MELWLDANLPPQLTPWISDRFGVVCRHVQEMDLLAATDPTIFWAARARPAALVTKDNDFVELVGRYGPPPQILVLACGNISNHQLRQLLSGAFAPALARIAAGEAVVFLGSPG